MKPRGLGFEVENNPANPEAAGTDCFAHQVPERFSVNPPARGTGQASNLKTPFTATPLQLAESHLSVQVRLSVNSRSDPLVNR
jgi:hypothetical protein